MGGVFGKAVNTVSLPMPVDVPEIAQNVAVNPFGIVQDIATRFQDGRDTVASFVDDAIPAVKAGFNTAAGLFSAPINAATSGLYSVEHPLTNAAIAAPDVLKESANAVFNAVSSVPMPEDVLGFSAKFVEEVPNAFNSPEKIMGAGATFLDGLTFGNLNQMAGFAGGVGRSFKHTLQTGSVFDPLIALNGHKEASERVDRLLENYNQSNPFMSEVLSNAGNLGAFGIMPLAKTLKPLKAMQSANTGGSALASSGLGAASSVLRYAGSPEMLRNALINSFVKGVSAKGQKALKTRELNPFARAGISMGEQALTESFGSSVWKNPEAEVVKDKVLEESENVTEVWLSLTR
ncbi:MAG: hypothetical protein FWC85_01030 [Elusimicrobia bacterium]|nr:hypothetical protein [Elusimicrobiota bacterium]